MFLASSVTYLFGLLTVMLITLTLKVTIGRLRPDFLIICRPRESACPGWSTILNSKVPLIRNPSGAQDLAALQAENEMINRLKDRGYVISVSTPSPLGPSWKSRSVYNNSDCTETDVLKLKWARWVWSWGKSIELHCY